ncbi:MAG: DUF4105 domain-containing protein [Bacteroidales bacterium]
MKISKILLSVIALFLFSGFVFAGPALSSGARVSLLTQEGGKEIYALWGHTAIRIQDDSLGIDDIFNYGMFDFSSPNFAGRFVKGETDYILGVNSMHDVYMEAIARNLNLTEQHLNLTQSEKQRLWDALLVNAMPQNRTYRYSFVFDNCATRPANMIESNLDGRLMFADSTATGGSLRDIVHETTGDFPWLRFGVNMIFGSRFDQPVTFREQFFQPTYLKNAYNEAYVLDPDGTKRPLVDSSVLLLKQDPELIENDSVLPAPGWFVYPIGLLLLIFTFRNGFRKRKLSVVPDILFYGLSGIAGCIIYFLALISTHPGMFPNGVMLLFEPLQLVFALGLLIKPWRRFVLKFHYLNAFMAFGFILTAPFVTQIYPFEVLFLAVISLIRSVMWIKITRICCEK